MPQVVRFVVGRMLRGVRARLPGHAASRVAGESYPGMIPSPAAETGGLLYDRLTDQDLIMLDAFEGELYERTRVQVFTRDGACHECWTYVVRGAFREHLSVESWILREFIRKDMVKFMKSLSAGSHETEKGERAHGR